MGNIIRKSKKFSLLLLLLGQATFSFASEGVDPGLEAFYHTQGIAWYVAIFALIVVPAVTLTVFWKIHIFPEKVAEKRNHPHKDAIAALCILSLFVGGMLWPIAVVWAYARPVMVYTRDAKHREEDERKYMEQAKSKSSEEEEA